MRDQIFREARWRRAGATDDQIAQLAEAHTELDPEAQAAEGARVDSVSDTDLAAELDAGTQDPTRGNAEDVITRVGADRELAAVVLSHEQAKARPRKGVIEAMSALLTAESDA